MRWVKAMRNEERNERLLLRPPGPALAPSACSAVCACTSSDVNSISVLATSEANPTTVARAWWSSQTERQRERRATHCRRNDLMST